MATYKVIQDIEAEDKILGPFTFRQFVYGLISGFSIFICYVCVIKGLGFLLILFLPPALFTGFFAIPFGKDQSTEVWALAKIRFFVKPRRRIWDQSGIKELVTITAPKKVERLLTNGLDETEVKSRLEALANTIDSRGWAIKNVNVNMFSQPNPLMEAATDSDRLIDLNSMPKEVPSYDIQASDDMLDEVSNPIAHQFQTMIDQSTASHRRQLVDELNGIREEEHTKQGEQPADYWFLHQATPPPGLPKEQTVFPAAPVVRPGASNATSTNDVQATADERAVIQKAKEVNDQRHISYAHLKTIQPLGSTPTPAPAAAAPAPTTTDTNDAAQSVTPAHNPAILSLASNNDLNVSTIAREAHKANGHDGSDEVVISLR